MYRYVFVITLSSLNVSCIEGAPSLIDVDECKPCLEFVEREVDYLSCIPDPSSIRSVEGVWFQPLNTVDSIRPILHLRNDGVFRRIYEPTELDFESNRIESTVWVEDEQGVTETRNGKVVARLLFDKKTDDYITWKNGPTVAPWVRVRCSGFGFPKVSLEEPLECTSCTNVNERCQWIRDTSIQAKVCIPDWARTP